MNSSNEINPIRLEVFKHLFTAIPEEMGAVLRKSSYSPNIKERLDFSCALFDAEASMISQAAHIPVHLGAMPLSVQYSLKEIDLAPGDMVTLNDPYRGGTHLPDITLVAPIFVKDELFGFAANRAHHADVGGMTAGSMPIAQELFQEGLIIPPIKLIEAGEINQGNWNLILANVRTPVERAGDLRAQIAANQRGVQRMQELANQYGIEDLSNYATALLDYTERMTRNLLAEIPNGEYSFADALDDDGISDEPIPIKVSIKIEDHAATVDFNGSAPQQKGSVNAVYAITLSAVYYVFRCLLSADVPNNSGSLRPIQVIAPESSVVNASHPAPVAGGNVETSQRITDVLLGALSQAMPDRIPAASQGTMNNTLIGGIDPRNKRSFTYYETICGGMGARPGKDGASGIHTHMTNTLNTPVEALEFAYPLQVMRYEIREGTGGAGQFKGGNGVYRDIKVLIEAQATQLSERRKTKPYGLEGGEPGSQGVNILIRDSKETELPSKGTFDLKAGDILSVRTPGGGGYGKK
ncbi:MAG: hydantoinase B/oxoprolinase family protein [Chloroflexi bacterium]|nr:MAG: hydantoinase B/oxoprolinase family protein [Chloroflexota bacterium]MBL1193578.1 hydantoinase B/oxoprolinase family protein [Chloroflexota bacterium]NOH10869.1 hydantoinase B/oxoprolinase family protein [Chloroflexota bacterium]